MECVTVNIILKILHSRWTVVLKLECIVLQWTLTEILDHEDWKSIKKLSCFEVCNGRCRLELTVKCLISTTPQVLQRRWQDSLSLFEKLIFMPIPQKELNSKPFICSTIWKFSIFVFTKFSKFRHSIRIEVHSLYINQPDWNRYLGCALALKYAVQCYHTYCWKGLFGWTIIMFNCRGEQYSCRYTWNISVCSVRFLKK